jgi:hypothetical protein
VPDWRARSTQSWHSYLLQLGRLDAFKTEDSIVRDFSTFESGLFSIEQEISIYLVTHGNGWTGQLKYPRTKAVKLTFSVLVWSEIGKSLQQGPSGPWKDTAAPEFDNASSTHLLPVIQARPGNGFGVTNPIPN